MLVHNVVARSRNPCLLIDAVAAVQDHVVAAVQDHNNAAVQDHVVAAVSLQVDARVQDHLVAALQNDVLHHITILFSDVSRMSRNVDAVKSMINTLHKTDNIKVTAIFARE